MALSGIHNLNQQFQKYRNFIVYSMIGIGGLVIDVGLFWLLHSALDINYYLANTVSSLTSMTNNFLWNSFINFNVRDNLISRYFRFIGVGIIGIILTTLIFYIFIDHLHFLPLLVKIFSIGVVVIVQYFLNSRITFKE